jgi:hypothetical protein
MHYYFEDLYTHKYMDGTPMADHIVAMLDIKHQINDAGESLDDVHVAQVMVLSLPETQSWDIIKIQLLTLNQPNSPLTWYPPNSSLRQTVRRMRRGLVIQPYTSKRRTHANMKKDREMVPMQFAVMEAIQVIRPKNAPTTTKTATRRRPSHNLNPPTLQSAISRTWILVR